MTTLVQVLREPRLLAAASLQDWEGLLLSARAARLSAALGPLATAAGVLDKIPPAPRAWLAAERTRCDFVQRQVRNEIAAIRRALGETPFPIILLKGSAYIAAELPCAPGRFLSDVDLMVPREALDEVERRLRDAGWTFDDLDDYDQRYYRDWSHELPPLTSRVRGIELDVHHNISPPVSRLKVDATRLIADAVALGDAPWPYRGLFVLAPPDMVLHSATHLFFNDELRGGLRDVFDLHRLCEHFASVESHFYPDLVARAEALGLDAPLWFALTHVRHFFGTQVPEATLAALSRRRGPISRVTWQLTRWRLDPEHQGGVADRIALRGLILRSHWMRMPPGLLVRHAWHKAAAGTSAGLAGMFTRNE